MKKSLREFYLDKPYASITQVKSLGNDESGNPIHNDNVVRVYCCQFPDVFNFQIRTYKGIGDFNSGTKRDMIATVTLNIKEVESLLKHMKAEKNRRG